MYHAPHLLPVQVLRDGSPLLAPSHRTHALNIHWYYSLGLSTPRIVLRRVPVMRPRFTSGMAYLPAITGQPTLTEAFPSLIMEFIFLRHAD